MSTLTGPLPIAIATNSYINYTKGRYRHPNSDPEKKLPECERNENTAFPLCVTTIIHHVANWLMDGCTDRPTYYL